jgi:hypothetical protein
MGTNHFNIRAWQKVEAKSNKNGVSTLTKSKWHHRVVDKDSEGIQMEKNVITQWYQHNKCKEPIYKISTIFAQWAEIWFQETLFVSFNCTNLNFIKIWIVYIKR